MSLNETLASISGLWFTKYVFEFVMSQVGFNVFLVYPAKSNVN